VAKRDDLSLRTHTYVASKNCKTTVILTTLRHILLILHYVTHAKVGLTVEIAMKQSKKQL